ncbi:AI-2E family transporter [Candidatus Kaiserbacteria bacterium]|nr:AI-2E family transporter [Candidatus Kaiserbacteria bacterium]
MGGRPVSIAITTGTIIAAVVVLVGAWLLWELRDLILVLITAVVIASAIEPGVVRLIRLGVPRVGAVLLIYLLIFAAFFGIFYFFVPSVLSELITFITSLPAYLETLDRISAFDEYARILGAAPPDLGQIDLMASLRGSLEAAGAFGNALTAVASVFGGVLSFILIIVFSFYFGVIETGVEDFLEIVAPRKYRAYVLDLWRRSRHKIGLWMQGQLLLAVIIGVLVYLVLTILGIKHALLLAVVAAVFELIPVFGPTLAALPAVLIGFVDGGVVTGLLVIGVYVLLQQFENHLIYPLVVTRVVGVPPLLVILALIVGAQLAGFLGILLSVPIAATVQEFVNDIRERRVFADSSE